MIAFNPAGSYPGMSFSTLVTHELVHIFQLRYGWTPGEDHALGSYATYNYGSNWSSNKNLVLQCNLNDFGYGACTGNTVDWQHASDTIGSEVFSDFFSAFAFDTWSSISENYYDVLIARYSMKAQMFTGILTGPR
jgi:hypothetical protein